MEEDKLLSQLSSEEPDQIQEAVAALQTKLYKNNGVLIMQNLGKFKNCLLSIFENSEAYKETKVMLTLFEFLGHFLSNNFSKDYEVQITSHILPELIRSCLHSEGKVLEAAKDALDAYIRSYKQLQIVLDYLLTNTMSSDKNILTLKGIQLAAENIEYHPKIISAESREFITFIERLCSLRASKDPSLSSKARNVLMDFLKRFPATVNEIANEMASRDIDDLSKLIKLRNETIQYK